jgi:hypothetical protein
MQSSDYVPGVSGWKLEKGVMELFGPWGNIRLADLDKTPEPVAPPKPFIVVDGVTYIRQDQIDESSIQDAKLTPEWTVKMELLSGKYVVTGIGLGLSSQFLVSADRFSITIPAK